MTNNEDTTNFDGLLKSGDICTGFISGATFKNKAVQYSVVDGLAIFEGCICLGTVEEMEKKTAAIRAGQDEDIEEDPATRGLFIPGQQYRWTNGIVPYEIDPNLPNQKRITDAIAHWEQKTHIRFVNRTSNNANQYPNYIRFRSADGCWSFIGMRGGKQDIGLANGCGLGATIHEIGHALGLWHEQSREDRDRHIQIHWQNIESDHQHNFNQHINDGDDHGSYDYDSIMHYGSTAFSKNGQPTITTVSSGRPIGQRNGLSNGDIATIRFLYPGTTPQLRPYTIKQGDTLYLIAERELGDGNRWREIMKTSNGGSFTEQEANNLQAGQVVYLP
jgi:Astacin (Peptidase family M12A)/LysM domain